MNPHGDFSNVFNDNELCDDCGSQVDKNRLNDVQNGNKSNITQAILEITKLDISDSEKSRLIDLLLQ